MIEIRDCKCCFKTFVKFLLFIFWFKTSAGRIADDDEGGGTGGDANGDYTDGSDGDGAVRTDKYNDIIVVDNWNSGEQILKGKEGMQWHD